MFVVCRQLAAAGPKRKKKASDLIRDEWAELQNETRLLKKVKKGKLSQRDFEIAVGERKKNGQERNKLPGSDDDDDDASADDGASDSGDSGSDSDNAAPPNKKTKR